MIMKRLKFDLNQEPRYMPLLLTDLTSTHTAPVTVTWHMHTAVIPVYIDVHGDIFDPDS